MNSAELKNTCCLMESNSMEQCDSHHAVRDLGGREGGGGMGVPVRVDHVCFLS